MQHVNEPVSREPAYDDTTGLPLPRGTFRVACWLVRPAENVIQRWDGEAGTAEPEQRRLEPRLMRLLCLLAGQPGQVVSRDALMSALWPRVVVNENSLTRAVSDLRRKLADGADRACIETVPKSGYKLVAPVTGIREEAVRPASGAPQDGREQHVARAGRFRPGLSALAAFNGMVAAGLLALLVVTNDSDRTAAVDTTPLLAGGSDMVRGGDVLRGNDQTVSTALLASARQETGGTANSPADTVISPDGSLVAFTRRTDEGSSLMVGSLIDQSDPLQVYASQHRISHLQWSPVGNALLFSVLPRVSHAALGERDNGRLMLFDLRNLEVRELYRGDQTPDGVPARMDEALNVT